MTLSTKKIFRVCYDFLDFYQSRELKDDDWVTIVQSINQLSQQFNDNKLLCDMLGACFEELERTYANKEN